MLPSPLMAAKSFAFTLHVSQYNMLAADLANNLKVIIWSRGSGACGKKEGNNAAALALPGCVSWRHELGRPVCMVRCQSRGERGKKSVSL